MMTLLFMAMFTAALVLGLVPVVLFGLMLETCEERARVSQVAVDPRLGAERLSVDPLRIAA